MDRRKGEVSKWHYVPWRRTKKIKWNVLGGEPKLLYSNGEGDSPSWIELISQKVVRDTWRQRQIVVRI